MPDPEPEEEKTGTGYLTAAEAGKWLEGHVVDIAAWTAATSAQKEAALEEASDSIDGLMLKGWKYDPDQAREFPRRPDIAARTRPDDSEIYYQSSTLPDYSEVPAEVEAACCLEALAILEGVAAPDQKVRRSLQQQGVTHATYSTTSETYAPGAGAGVLQSKKARQLLQGWIAGSVEIV